MVTKECPLCGEMMKLRQREVIERVPGLAHAAHVKQRCRDKLIEHRRYVGEHVRDVPDTEDWS